MKLDHNARRRKATDDKIADAVVSIAVDQGPKAVTFSEVSRVSGVAKTTLYRRYQRREEILDAVADRFTWVPSSSDPAPVTQAGLVTILRRAFEFLEERIGIRSIGTVLSSEDPFMQKVREHILFSQTEAVQRYLERGVEAGVLRDDLDYSVLLDVFVGAMIMRCAREGTIDYGWSETLAQMIWPFILKQDDHTG